MKAGVCSLVPVLVLVLAVVALGDDAAMKMW